MRPCFSVLRCLQKISLYSLPALLTAPAVLGGIMDCKNYTVDDYRNFAENRGKFAAGATNIPIYDKNGNQTGTIERMMNFDSAIDVWSNNETITKRSGEATLAGGPNFLAGVAHDYEQTSVSFTRRFGGTEGTAYADNYQIINAINGDSDLYPGSPSSSRDFRISRLSKIVTEATASDYYEGDFNSLIGQTLQRVGGGEPIVVTENGSNKTDLEYMWLSGGLVKITAVTTNPAKPGNGPAWDYETVRISTESINNSTTTPMVNQAAGGDSGSGAWWYDNNAEKWYYVGALTSGSTVQDGDATGRFLGASKWAVSVIDGYNQQISTNADGTILWTQGESTAGSELAESKLMLDGQQLASYTTLAENYIGDTSASGYWRADDTSLDACKNLILQGTGNNVLEVKGLMDTGAGYIQFKTDFTVRASDAETRLNTAGWVIDKNVTVKTELTGSNGDEWRMIGDGNVQINGTGNNGSDLNIGGNLLVDLNRTGGVAVENLKINAGNAIVRITGDGNQIGGSVVFGHRGGVLDLYGHDWAEAHAFVGFENTSDLIGQKYIAVMDSGARIANLKANSSSVFTYTAQGATKYIGSFLDDGAHGAILNIDYSGGQNGQWTLSGIHQTSGTWKINSGNMIIAGELQDYYGNQNDYNTAVLQAGTVLIANGSGLTAGTHSRIQANIESSGTLHLAGDSVLTGNIRLAATGAIDAAIASGESTLQGIVSGTGSLTKSGTGALVLTNANNNFTGTATIREGIVKADSAEALGQTRWNVQEAGTIFADASEWSAYKAKINSISQGTIALSGQIDNVSDINMRGLSSMSLGAAGSATLGSKGTTDILQGWTMDNGYNFSGSTGELIVNARLSGSGAIAIGGNGKNGIVELAGDNSGYTGEITINRGSGVVMSGTNMINQISSSSLGTLLVRGQSNDNYDFTGKSNLRFGTDSTADYSGQLKGGSYIFGGTGTLRLISSISGNAMIESGTHVWVNVNNAISGTVNVKENAVLQIGDGASGGSIGTGKVNLDWGARLIFNSDADMIIGTSISGLGSINKDGAGTTILTSTAEGAKINVNNGALQLGNGGKSGGIGRNTQIDLAGGTSLIIDRSDNIDLLQQYIHEVDGAAKVIKKGTGKLTIGYSRNNYTGGTFVQEGTLAFASVDAANNKAVTLEGGCFDMGGLALTNAVTVSVAGSSLQNTSNYAGTLTVNANMAMNGKLGTGAANVIIGDGSTLTWNNSLDWFETNTVSLNSLTNNGTLNFDFSGTSSTLNSEKSWRLMETSQGAFGKYEWLKNSVSVAKGYVAGLSDVNGILSFVVTKIPVIDENGNVIGDYTPGAGDITDVNNVNSSAVLTVQNGVNAGISGNIDGSVSIAAGGTATLANTDLNGYLTVDGGAVQADAGKTVSIGNSGALFIQNGLADNIVTVSALGTDASISNGFKASTESNSSVAMAGSYDNANLEFQKNNSSILVETGEEFHLSSTSQIGNAAGISGTSIQVSGIMNNNSTSVVGTNVSVKKGGLLTGTGNYGGTVSVEGGGTFKIGNSPGISSVTHIDFSGGEGTGTLDFSVNGDIVATTGGWTDNGYSQLTVSGLFSIENAINFNVEIGKEYFNNIASQDQSFTTDYVFLLFTNSATFNLDGTTYNLFDAQEIQAWFDNHASWSFNSSDAMALTDNTNVSINKLTYSYDETNQTASLTATLKYGSEAAIPEPASALLLLAGGGMLISRRRRTAA